MTLDFAHQTAAQRLVVGADRAAENVVAEVGRLGAQRVLMVASPSAHELSAGIRELLDPTDVLMWSRVAAHVPIELVQEVRHVAADHGSELIIAVGGGSAIGLAKAVAVTTHLPIIAVPTTFAGSEATDIWGVTQGREKRTASDPHVLPTVVVYDATLTRGLPASIAIPSALNGLAHCVDSLWAPNADPLNAVLASAGARALSTGIRSLARDPQDLAAHETAQLGCYLAGAAFSSAGSGLHHKICHVLGGACLAHAQTHAVVLPHVARFNLPAAESAAALLADALGDDPLSAIVDLCALSEGPRTLRELGMSSADIPAAAAAILRVVPSSNPRPVTEADLRDLLRRAWGGDPTAG